MSIKSTPVRVDLSYCWQVFQVMRLCIGGTSWPLFYSILAIIVPPYSRSYSSLTTIALCIINLNHSTTKWYNLLLAPF